MNKLIGPGRWESHPWTRTRMVRHCPVWLLEIIADRNVNEYTYLASGDYVHQEELWSNIEKVGMHEPLLLNLSMADNTLSLESGSHRVLMAKKNGLTHLPVALMTTQETMRRREGIDASKLVYWDRIRECKYPMQLDPIDTLKFEEFKFMGSSKTKFLDFFL